VINNWLLSRGLYSPCCRIPRADSVAARTRPTVDLPVGGPNAPGELGEIYEMEAVNDDPPPPYETPNAIIDLQQGRSRTNEHGVESLERHNSGGASRVAASAYAPVGRSVPVASAHA
jgi:hypothetical protein